jgi:hypothetical protein
MTPDAPDARRPRSPYGSATSPVASASRAIVAWPTVLVSARI